MLLPVAYPADLHSFSAATRQSGAPLGAIAHSDCPVTTRDVPSRPTAPAASAAPFAISDAVSAAFLLPSKSLLASIVDFQPLFMASTDSSNQRPNVSNNPGFCSVAGGGAAFGWAGGADGGGASAGASCWTGGACANPAVPDGATDIRQNVATCKGRIVLIPNSISPHLVPRPSRPHQQMRRI